jgi:DNA repair exonuclease SbcCD ATPase subunit
MDSRDERIGDLENRIALNARLHGEENDKLRAHVSGLQAALEAERRDLARVRSRLDAFERLPDVADLESALVDAFESELDDYQNAPETWNAVTRVLDALRARDARITALEAELRELRAARDGW